MWRGGEIAVESIENVRLSIASPFLSTQVHLGCRLRLDTLYQIILFISHPCSVTLIPSYSLLCCLSEALQTFRLLKCSFHILYFDWLSILFTSHLIWFNLPELIACDGIISPVPTAVVTCHAVSGPSSPWNVVLGMRVLGVCYPNCASSDKTVHLGCLENSASQLSCALRKCFLRFVEQQSEMPNIVKEVCGAAGKRTLISQCLSSALITRSSPLPHLKFISWSWASMSNCIFHLFSLASAYSLRHWRRVEFLHVGSLLQYCSFIPLFFFASLLTSQVVWNQVSIPFYVWNAVFCIHTHTCCQKFHLCPPF